MLKWFGLQPFAPACEPDNRMNTPVAALCAWCAEPIMHRDDGYAMPRAARLDELGMVPATPRYEFKHYECHQLDMTGHPLCILTHGPMGVCPDGSERDPPGFTRRQAARFAEQLADLRRTGRLTSGVKLAWLARFWPEIASQIAAPAPASEPAPAPPAPHRTPLHPVWGFPAKPQEAT